MSKAHLIKCLDPSALALRSLGTVLVGTLPARLAGLTNVTRLSEVRDDNLIHNLNLRLVW